MYVSTYVQTMYPRQKDKNYMTLTYFVCRGYKNIVTTVNVLKFHVADKMAYADSADPDHTAPEGAV